MFRFLSFSVFVLFCSGMLFANGPGLPTTEAVGNVDGVLNWSLGSIAPNDSKLQTVFLVYGLTLSPGYHIFQEPYLTLLGSAGWGAPVQNTGQPGYGFADVIPGSFGDDIYQQGIEITVLL